MLSGKRVAGFARAAREREVEAPLSRSRRVDCHRCGAALPLWSQTCPTCGAVQFEAPALSIPPELAAPRPEAPAPEPEPAPPAAAPAKDYRPHLAAGALLAFVATLVVPPLTGGIAIALGWLAYSRGAGAQRRQGLLVIVAGLAGTAIGLAIALWAEQAGILGAP